MSDLNQQEQAISMFVTLRLTSAVLNSCINQIMKAPFRSNAPSDTEYSLVRNCVQKHISALEKLSGPSGSLPGFSSSL